VLGKGGVGAVFRAEHNVMKKEYAVKVLLADSISQDSWQRFSLEARAIAKMDHANIVKVHNMGTDEDGRPYYVMDLLHGKTLQALSRAKAEIPLPIVLDIFSQIARGLAYAHDKGIIHRDIKPSNIMLIDNKKNYDVKIVDFGMVKLGKNQAAINSQFETKAGEVLGSPLYMSPEQCTGDTCDERSDVYSLGCTLFEILTKSLPFKGQSAMETMMMHQSARPPALRERRPDKTFTMTLEAIVAKMLEKSPAARYQSMHEVVRDLERVAAGKPIGAAGYSTLQNFGTTGATSMGEQEYSSSYNNSNKKLLLISGAAALALTAIGAAVYFVVVPKPTKDISQTTVKRYSDLVPNIGVKSLNEKQVDVNPEDKRILNVLLNCDPILSRIVDTRDGKFRLVHFPTETIGFYSYLKANKVLDTRHAKNDRFIPIGAPLALSVCPGDEIVPFFHPQIYKKIGPEEIAELGISGSSESWLGNTPEKLQKKAWQHALEILDIASTWKALKSLTLMKLALNSPEACAKLDKFTHLDNLDLEDMPDLAGATIARTRVFDNLHSLRIHNCGSVLALASGALAHHQLQKLSLDGTDLDESTVKAIAAASTLKTLSLAAGHLTEAKIQSLAQLKNIIELDIKDESLSDKEISQLLKQSKNRHLVLQMADYKKCPEIVAHFKNVRQVTFINDQDSHVDDF
jgi:serine/threonine protein kinase